MIAAVLLGGLGDASAATVSVSGTRIEFQAAPGERNAVSFDRMPDDAVRLSDAGAPLDIGPGCEEESGHAICDGYSLSLYLGDLDDSVTGTSARSYDQPDVYGEEGDDMLAGPGRIDGGPGDDDLAPTGLATTDGGDGNDVLHGAGTLRGGAGDDRLIAVEPFQTIEGGDGNDAIDLSAIVLCPECGSLMPGADGGGGDDTLTGSDAADTLTGGAGADTLLGRGGRDVLDGGPGNDSLRLGDAVPDAFGGMGAQVPPWGYVGIDARATGGSGDDGLFGANGRDYLDGGDGSDSLESAGADDLLLGGEGDDTLRGGEGNDLLDGGGGADTVDGGAGTLDQIDLSDEAEGVAIDLTRPAGDGRPGEHDTYLPSVEFFQLTELADRFKAGRVPVRVYGGFGSDVLIGGTAPDVLVGGSNHRPETPVGRDTIEGRGGNDDVRGGPGSDTLRGGPGDDLMSGGSGNVRLGGTRARSPSTDTIFGGPGNDAISRGRRVSGGPGNDNIDLVDFPATNHSPVLPIGRDSDAHCGPGHDRASGDYYDGIGLDCETVWSGSSSWRTVRPDSAGHLTLTVRCAWRYGAPCRGVARVVPTTATVDQAGSFPWKGFAKPFPHPSGCATARQDPGIGARGFRIRSGRVDRVSVALNPRGKRILARAKCLLIRAAVRSKDPYGVVHETTRTLALRTRR